MNRRVIASLLTLLLAGAGLSFAEAAERADALLACAAEQDDARRLRCFDDVVDELRSAPVQPAPVQPAPAHSAAAPVAPAATVTASVPPPPPPPASAEERFGARGDINAEQQLSEITAKVTALSAKPHGQLIITLDNAQVWAEIATGSKIKLKPGDAVKIERGALGSYLLITPNGRGSRVARVR